MSALLNIIKRPMDLGSLSMALVYRLDIRKRMYARLLRHRNLFYYLTENTIIRHIDHQETSLDKIKYLSS